MVWTKAKLGAKLMVIKLAQLPRIGYYDLLSNCRILGRPVRGQPVQCVGLGTIEFKGRVRLGVYPSPFFFNGYCYLDARSKDAKLIFGDGTCINNNFVAISEFKSITIGKNVLIGTSVEIYDSNFHGIKPDKRRISIPEDSAEVVIEDNVFIGSNVKVLKGVTIGRDSVIANGSLVIKSIPSGVVAGGNPAKVIKYL